MKKITITADKGDTNRSLTETFHILNPLSGLVQLKCFLPDGTKALSEPMLICHQQGIAPFIYRQPSGNVHESHNPTYLKFAHLKSKPHLTGANELNLWRWYFLHLSVGNYHIFSWQGYYGTGPEVENHICHCSNLWSLISHSCEDQHVVTGILQSPVLSASRAVSHKLTQVTTYLIWNWTFMFTILFHWLDSNEPNISNPTFDLEINKIIS